MCLSEKILKEKNYKYIFLKYIFIKREILFKTMYNPVK